LDNKCPINVGECLKVAFGECKKYFLEENKFV